jgi:hypothetical protein
MTTESRSASESRGSTESFGGARTQAFRSIREERPTQLYSLEESFHLAQVKLRDLPPRVAIVKRSGQKTVQIRTLDVKPMLDIPPIVRRFRETVASKSTFVVTHAVAEAAIKERRRLMLPSNTAAGEGSFWQEES